MLVADGVRVPKELRTHVHRRPAALPIEGAHGQVVGVLEDILAHREVPASPHAGNLQVEVPCPLQTGKIRGLHPIAGVGVGLRRRQPPTENHLAVAKTFDLEGFGGGADERHLGTIQRIAHLVHLNGQPVAINLGAFSSINPRGRAKEIAGKEKEQRQLPDPS